MAIGRQSTPSNAIDAGLEVDPSHKRASRTLVERSNSVTHSWFWERPSSARSHPHNELRQLRSPGGHGRRPSAAVLHCFIRNCISWLVIWPTPAPGPELACRIWPRSRQNGVADPRCSSARPRQLFFVAHAHRALGTLLQTAVVLRLNHGSLASKLGRAAGSVCAPIRGAVSFTKGLFPVCHICLDLPCIPSLATISGRSDDGPPLLGSCLQTVGGP